MAMESPVARRIGGQVEADLAARQHIDGVLARIAAGMAVHHLEEMAVQMDRMGHHRVVDENDARAFVAFEADRLDAFAEFFAIERPHEAPHVRSEEHTTELQSLMRISYAVFYLIKNNTKSDINMHVNLQQ